MSQSNLTFRPERHEYRIDGVVVPSVTQVLSEAGLIDDQWYTEESQLRGRTVHIMTALDDEGGLDESKVPDEYRGYLDAWRLFKVETACEILAIERRVCNYVYQYAGTIDRVVQWPGVAEVVDIKTGVAVWWHPYQTAGYWMCHDVAVAARCCVYLSYDGTYKIKTHDKHSYDTDVFRAALTIANAKRNEGIKTNGNFRTDRN